MSEFATGGHIHPEDGERLVDAVGNLPCLIPGEHILTADDIRRLREEAP